MLLYILVFFNKKIKLLKGTLFFTKLFFNFILNPKIKINNNTPYFKYLDGILVILLPLIILKVIFSIILTTGSIDKLTNSFKLNDYYLYFYIIIIAPVLEETIFRYSLNGKNKSLIISSISSLIYILIRTKFLTNPFTEVDYALMGLFLLYLCAFLYKRISFQILFYISTTIFAVLHIFNFELSIYSLPIHIFTILIYLVIGFAFAFFRIKYGFLTSLKFHVIYNLFSVLGMIITGLF